MEAVPDVGHTKYHANGRGERVIVSYLFTFFLVNITLKQQIPTYIYYNTSKTYI